MSATTYTAKIEKKDSFGEYYLCAACGHKHKEKNTAEKCISRLLRVNFGTDEEIPYGYSYGVYASKIECEICGTVLVNEKVSNGIYDFDVICAECQ